MPSRCTWCRATLRHASSSICMVLRIILLRPERPKLKANAKHVRNHVGLQDACCGTSNSTSYNGVPLPAPEICQQVCDRQSRRMIYAWSQSGLVRRLFRLAPSRLDPEHSPFDGALVGCCSQRPRGGGHGAAGE